MRLSRCCFALALGHERILRHLCSNKPCWNHLQCRKHQMLHGDYEKDLSPAIIASVYISVVFPTTKILEISLITNFICVIFHRHCVIYVSLIPFAWERKQSCLVCRNPIKRDMSSVSTDHGRRQCPQPLSWA